MAEGNSLNPLEIRLKLNLTLLSKFMTVEGFETLWWLRTNTFLLFNADHL